MKRGLKWAGLGLAGLLALSLAVTLVFYLVDGHAVPAAEGFLHGEGYSVEQDGDGDWLYTPDAAHGTGLAIMHGALIEPLSYARTAAFFAKRGYTVWVPRGVMRLSLMSADRIAEELATVGPERWVLLGHSMGGMTALTVKQKTSAEVLGVSIWAGSMPGDFSGESVPLLYLWGDHDGMIPPERFERTKRALPASTRYATVAGANHRNFAMYSHQFMDAAGTLTQAEQIGAAQELTLPFFEGLRTPAP